jgi:two-component sensor histidine kinase
MTDTEDVLGPLLQNIVDNAPTPVFVKDPGGKYLYANAAYERTARLPREEIVGRTDFDIWPLDVAEACLEHDIEAIRLRTPIQNESPVDVGTGLPTFSAVKFPIFDEQGSVLGICGLLSHITDRLGELVRLHERNRIAIELHDDALQVMATIALRLETLERDVADKQRGRLAEVRMMVSDAVQRLRVLTADMQATDSEDLDLRTALEELLQSIEREHLTSFSLNCGPGEPIHSAVALGLYRIAHEALINVTKHARASRVEVNVIRLSGEIRMSIADDGIGFEEANIRSHEHMGLLSMRSRAHSLGGTLDIRSLPGEGTRVEISVPDLRNGVFSNGGE